MKRVYIVTHGCYSDYSVALVTLSKTHAQRVADEMSKPKSPDDYVETHNVEEVAFLETGEMPTLVTQHFRFAELTEGAVGREWSHCNTAWSHNILPTKRPRVHFVKAPMHGGKGGRLEVVGTDVGHVEKAYHDRIRMFKAGAWCPDWTPGTEVIK